jgi:hypothetical protein
MALYKVLGDSNPSGVKVVNGSTELLSIYGTSDPVDQPAAITSVDTTGASSTTNAYGYTTAAQADAIVASLNAVIVALRETSFIAT